MTEDMPEKEPGQAGWAFSNLLRKHSSVGEVGRREIMDGVFECIKSCIRMCLNRGLHMHSSVRGACAIRVPLMWWCGERLLPNLNHMSALAM